MSKKYITLHWISVAGLLILLFSSLFMFGTTPAFAIDVNTATINNVFVDTLTETSAILHIHISGDTNGTGAALNYTEISPFAQFDGGLIRGTFDTALPDGNYTYTLVLGQGYNTYIYQIWYGDASTQITHPEYHFRVMATIVFNNAGGAVSGVPGLSGGSGGLPGDSQISCGNATKIGYDTAYIPVTLGDLGTHTSLTINFQYGTNSTYSLLIPVANSINLPQSWTIPLTGLTSNTLYYFRAVALDGTYEMDSSGKQFTTLNPNQPSFIQGITAFFGSTGLGTNFWWIIIIVFNLGVWFFFRNSKVIAMVLSALSVGAMIVLGLVDIWLIVLLAIVAGLAFYMIVIRGGAGSAE